MVSSEEGSAVLDGVTMGGRREGVSFSRALLDAAIGIDVVMVVVIVGSSTVCCCDVLLFRLGVEGGFSLSLVLLLSDNVSETFFIVNILELEG